jgi:hypothetical protein
MLSHWQTFKDKCGSWEASFPPEMWREPAPLFELVDLVCEVGKREGVYEILEVPARDEWAYSAAATPTLTWGEHVRRMWRDHRSLMLFPAGGPVRTDQGQLRTPARLCVFDEDGNVVERVVEDVGALFLATHPETDHAPHVCPIEIYGPFETDRAYPLDLTVRLETDIWFPHVIGLDFTTDDVEMVPNAFAACHTPRFNRFLAALHAKVLELGGTWAINVEGTARNYAPWMLDDGIRLTP